MFSDDDLMDTLVLKGGNALDIIYKVADRASVDLDFSIKSKFDESDLSVVGRKIEAALVKTFREEGYVVFDVYFIKKPKVSKTEMEDFWGGYKVEFKLIDREQFQNHSNNLEYLRKHAEVVGNYQKKKFYIEISKYEYCDPKSAIDFDGYTIYVYTPIMIAFEKLRAICQQMSEYSLVVNNPGRSARARDFFDIYTIIEKYNLNLEKSANKNLLKNIFQAKKVPLNLIGKISKYREYHRPDFQSVVDTVKPNVKLKKFDYYFDYVVKKFSKLETLWIK